MNSEQILDIWKQNLDIQKHFNDLIIQVRERAITVLGAGIVAAGFLFQESYVLTQPIRLIHLVCLTLFVLTIYIIIKFKIRDSNYIHNTQLDKSKQSVLIKNWFSTLVIPAASIFILYVTLKHLSFFNESWLYQKTIIQNPSLGGVALFALCLVWSAFYLMDRFWYHRLLKGAVASAIPIEDIIFNQLPSSLSQPADSLIGPSAISSLGGGLGNGISANSSIYILGQGRKYKYLRIDSSSKIDIFYTSIFIVLFALGAILIKNPDDMIDSQDKAKVELKEKQLTTRIDSLKRIVIKIELAREKDKAKLNLDSLLINKLKAQQSLVKKNP
jgi:hypothetical protein